MAPLVRKGAILVSVEFKGVVASSHNCNFLNETEEAMRFVKVNHALQGQTRIGETDLVDASQPLV